MAVIIIVEDDPEIAGKLKTDMLSLFRDGSGLMPRIRTLTTAMAVQKGYLPSRKVTFRLRKPSDDNSARDLTIDVSRILFIEVQDHLVRLHLVDSEDAEYRLAMPLKECEQLLDPVLFVRCHQSHLVNLYYVKEVTGSSVLLEGNGIRKTLRLSRSYQERFSEAMNEYRLI